MQLKLPQLNDIANKTVLLRVDYNVPLKKNDDGTIEIEDTTRIEASLETIKFLLENNAKVVIIAHLGRPKANDHSLSLEPIADYLKDKCQPPAAFCPSCIGDEAKKCVESLNSGELIVMENLRFHDEEEANDENFAKQLSELADVYINDAFSNAHRAHASMVGVTKFLPSFAGFNLEKEVTALSSLLDSPKRPFVVILGGAKISDKVSAVEHLSDLADIVLVGGAVANDFLKAEGLEIYRSYIEDASSDKSKQDVDYVAFAKKLIDDHKNERMLKDGYIPLPKILYPIDVLAAPKALATSYQSTSIINTPMTNDQWPMTIDLSHGMEDTDEQVDLQYLDIGPSTIKLFSEIIAQAGTIFWNGPMGVWENILFEKGTKDIAIAITNSPAKTVIGGGDTISAVDHFELKHKFTYVSAAGGAALDFLGGKMLPAIEPLLLSSK